MVLSKAYVIFAHPMERLGQSLQPGVIQEVVMTSPEAIRSSSKMQLYPFNSSNIFRSYYVHME
jgi:hypothetical protein